MEGWRVLNESARSKVLISLPKLGDILEAGLWVQSALSEMQFKSPPMQPESCLLRSSFGMVSDKYCSLLDFEVGRFLMGGRDCPG